jgi:GxxExxY protein
MDTDAHRLKQDPPTEAVIGSAFEVSRVLGAGFLEKVYERAMAHELALRGLQVRPQVAFRVCYKGQYIGEYIADLVVEEKLLVELKCVERLADEHLAQCINYLKASGLGTAPSSIFRDPKSNGSALFSKELCSADTPACF